MLSFLVARRRPCEVAKSFDEEFLLVKNPGTTPFHWVILAMTGYGC